MIKPIHTLLLLIGLGIATFITAWAFPEDGIKVSEGLTLEFSSVDDFLPSEEDEEVEEIGDVEEFLEIYEVEVDSVAILDSLKAVEIARRQALVRIQYNEDDPAAMSKFFAALKGVKDGGKARVMHYGDSQLEGDRITGYVRNELQKEFGGQGPGLVPAVEVIPTIAVDQNDSGNWGRYTIFGKKDTTIKHNRYGMLASFSRFTPEIADSLLTDSVQTAWFEVGPSRLTYSKAKRFNRAHLYYGHNKRACQMKIYEDDSLVVEETIPANSSFSKKTIKVSSGKLKYEFEGVDSPEIYGVSLEGTSGINMDNIPLRGSAGTIFRKIERAQLSSQYAGMDIKLFILQFGGNTVPHIPSTERAQKYGGWFKSQIKLLQSLVPDASIVVIGPSDMSIKEKGEFVTRPFLEDVRDALKVAAFETGCGFWDIYEVMGGKNSMKSWVEADPPLAGHDYTHFTPKGARRIAELFHKALWQDYEIYMGIEN
jgi:lysophospholipase L1-like esterase